MTRKHRSGPRSITPEMFGKFMEKAVPLDKMRDDRFADLLAQLSDVKETMGKRKAAAESKRR